MNLLERMRHFFQTEKGKQVEVNEVLPVAERASSKLHFTLPVTEEERELVSVIASAIHAGGNTDVQIRVEKVTRIDTEKEIAAAVIAAVAAGERPDSTFVLKSIEKIER